MNLPKSLFTATAKEREVFYFSTDKINTEESHYFICIKKSFNEIIMFTCCTTQFEKRERYIKLKGYPTSTLVYIKPDSSNGLKQDTWVDCNKFMPFTSDEFKALCESGKIEYKGEVSDIYYEQILIGLHASPAIEGVVKDDLPDPADIC